MGLLGSYSADIMVVVYFVMSGVDEWTCFWNISAINSEEKPKKWMFYVFMWCVMLSCVEALQWDCPLPFSWHFVLDGLQDYLLHNLIHNQSNQRADCITAEDKVTLSFCSGHLFLQKLFRDFEKTCVSFRKEVLYSPLKLVRLMKMCLNETHWKTFVWHVSC
jgi:hypothetical protein